MAYRIQVRADTAANWTSVDPTLAQAELGYETDTTKHKIGDGSTAWSALPYATQGIQGVPGDSALPAPYTADISGAYTIDASHPVQKLTVTGAVTISLPEPPAGRTTPLTVVLVQDATGYAVTLPTGSSTPKCRWGGDGVVPTIDVTPSSRHTLYFVGYPGDGWDGYVSALGQA